MVGVISDTASRPRPVGPAADLDGVRVIELFPVPVLTHAFADGPDLAARLRDVIRKRASETRGIRRTNEGGWHSEADLQDWPQPCVAELVERIHTLIRELVRRTIPAPRPEHLDGWTIEAWANVNGHGASNRSHDHVGAGNLWSGIFYVDTGGIDATTPELGGLTKFEDRSGTPKEMLVNPDPFEREFAVVPRTGLFVLFPASLRHHVDVYRGRSQRITIAFNLRHHGFAVPTYEDEARARRWWWRNFRGVMVGLQWLRRAGPRSNRRRRSGQAVSS